MELVGNEHHHHCGDVFKHVDSTSSNSSSHSATPSESCVKCTCYSTPPTDSVKQQREMAPLTSVKTPVNNGGLTANGTQKFSDPNYLGAIVFDPNYSSDSSPRTPFLNSTVLASPFRRSQDQAAPLGLEAIASAAIVLQQQEPIVRRKPSDLIRPRSLSLHSVNKNNNGSAEQLASYDSNSNSSGKIRKCGCGGKVQTYDPSSNFSEENPPRNRECKVEEVLDSSETKPDSSAQRNIQIPAQKQLLRKTPSTPSGNQQKSSATTLQHRASVKSGTSPTIGTTNYSGISKSRQTLPLSATSPSQSSQALGGQHSKRHAQLDHNPFGADLVRYGASSRVSPFGHNRLSQTTDSTSNLAACSSVNEDCALLLSTRSISREVKENGGNLNNLNSNNNNQNPNECKVDEISTLMDPLAKSPSVVFYQNDQQPPARNGPPAATGGFLRNRFSMRNRIRNRLVQKDGECNISLHNVPKQKSKYFADIFTTLVEVKWRWCLLIFATGFLLSWLIFGVMYFTIMYAHGDFDHSQNETDWKFCIHNINSFVSVFMFSLESQHTIGYGSRYPSDECPLIVATVCLQSMVGVMIQTFMAGIVFAKLARAKKRAQTLIFSKNAVVCMRDGKLCLLFRVGDMRKSQLAEAHVRLQMISKRITNEGELLPFHQFDLNVGYDVGLDRIFVVWPITICHVIDETSPLYEYSADDLATARFEIIAILEGVVPSTGTTTQARTSYLPQEIIWGSRFEKLVTYQRENGEYRIDFSKFHKMYQQETPNCSARDLDVLREAGLDLQEVYHIEGEEQAENQGLTPYSTVDSRVDPPRPSILPSPPPLVSVVVPELGNHHPLLELGMIDRSFSLDHDDNVHDHGYDVDDGRQGVNTAHHEDTMDETGHLLPPSASALLTMSPAERKASIAAAALAFRKNKSLSESARKVSLNNNSGGGMCSRFRKPSINICKVSVGDSDHNMMVNSPSRHGDISRLSSGAVSPAGLLRHAASTGSVAVISMGAGAGASSARPRPSSVLREHDIM